MLFQDGFLPIPDFTLFTPWFNRIQGFKDSREETDFTEPLESWAPFFLLPSYSRPLQFFLQGIQISVFMSSGFVPGVGIVRYLSISGPIIANPSAFIHSIIFAMVSPVFS